MFVKQGSNTQNIYARIEEILVANEIKVVSQGFVRGPEMYSRHIVELQYANLVKLAELTKPAEIPMNASEKALFMQTFSIGWDAVKSRNAYSCKDAVRYLEISVRELDRMCERSADSVRIRRGFHVTRITKQCTEDVTLKNKLIVPIFVVNGFYGNMRDMYCDRSAPSTRFYVIEWNVLNLSRRRFMEDVIGDDDPMKASSTSIRGSSVEDWEMLGLTDIPSRVHNIVHVSHSAFESLVDRITWVKGMTSYTDSFGSKLLEKVSATVLTSWLQNPLVGDATVFDHMAGLDAGQCLVKADQLLALATKTREFKSPEKELQQVLTQKGANSFNQSKSVILSLLLFTELIYLLLTFCYRCCE